MREGEREGEKEKDLRKRWGERYVTMLRQAKLFFPFKIKTRNIMSIDIL